MERPPELYTYPVTSQREDLLSQIGITKKSIKNKRKQTKLPIDKPCQSL